MHFNTITHPGVSENTLRTLGNKIVAGRDLNMAERLIAMTAAGQITARIYGPGPAEMEVRPLGLPENIKGILANYAG